MGIDIKTLSLEVMEALTERGHSAEAISEMTIHEAFEEYLAWHGIIGYTRQIQEALFDIGSSSTEVLQSTNQATEAVAKKYFGL